MRATVVVLVMQTEGFVVVMWRKASRGGPRVLIWVMPTHYHVRSNRCSLDVHYAPPVRKKLRLLNERPRLLFGELAPHQPLKPNITIITTTEMLRYYYLGNVIWYFLLSEEDGTWLL